MKIICSKCKTVLGEQKPFKDLTGISALCNTCISKEKEEALKAKPMPESGNKREITFENGLKGKLSIAGNETDNLSFGELGVASRKFFCYKDGRDKFCSYLKGLPGKEVDVMFLHSSKIKMDSIKSDGRKKSKLSEPPKHESINYNCTVSVPKEYAISMFDNSAERMHQIVEILAEVNARELVARQKSQDTPDKK